LYFVTNWKKYFTINILVSDIIFMLYNVLICLHHFFFSILVYSKRQNKELPSIDISIEYFNCCCIDDHTRISLSAGGHCYRVWRSITRHSAPDNKTRILFIIAKQANWQAYGGTGAHLFAPQPGLQCKLSLGRRRIVWSRQKVTPITR